MKRDTITVEEYRALVASEPQRGKRSKRELGRQGRDRYGSNARRTRCHGGHVHGSRLEQRVCDRLAEEVIRGMACGAPAATIFQQPRFPLLAIAPGEDGRPLTYTPDFALWLDGRLWRVVEAKSPGRVSRDFPVRRRAFEATYGVAVEVVSA